MAGAVAFVQCDVPIVSYIVLHLGGKSAPVHVKTYDGRQWMDMSNRSQKSNNQQVENQI